MLIGERMTSKKEENRKGIGKEENLKRVCVGRD
jgi:hypothetical protein